MKKNKSICSLGKINIEKEFESLSKLVNKPKHICLKCGRAANEKGNLCKPEKIKK